MKGVKILTGFALALLMLMSSVPSVIGQEPCESDFECDGDVDGSDIATFIVDFGRFQFNNPCTMEDPCNGDFECDGDVDATDVGKIIEDFGRFQFNDPCPACYIINCCWGGDDKSCQQEPPGGCGGGDSGSPVYLFSGEFHHSAIDLQIPGRGLDFVWGRKYRSKIGPNTAMGNGWDFSYNIYIEAGEQNLILHNGNTRSDTFILQSNGTWTCREFFSIIEKNPDNSYTLIFPDMGKQNFHPLDSSPQQGKITSVVDRNGNTQTFDYDGLGRLVTIHDSLDTPGHNRDITIAYNADNRIESVTDFAGRSVTYEYYDSTEPGGNFGDLESVTSPIVVNTPNFPIPPGHEYPYGKTTVYTYSTGFTDDRLNHNLLTIIDPKGQTYLVNEYYPTTDPNDSNFDRIMGVQAGEPDDITHFVYAEKAPTPDNGYAVTKAIVNDFGGNITELFFDSGNRSVIVRQYTGRANPNLPTTETENRPTGKLRPTDPDFFETRYEYNKDSLITRTVFPNDNEQVFTYDTGNTNRRSQGNLMQQCSLPGPLGGDQAQICESFEYDDVFGGCCGSNFVTKHTNGKGYTTEHTYDTKGNRIHTQYPIPSIVEDWECNEFGQMTKHYHPHNGSGCRREDQFLYYGPSDGHQNGYPKQENVDSTTPDLTTTYEYDLVGNVIRTIDAKGNDYISIYNSLNQKVRFLSPPEEQSGLRHEVDRYYDANDNLVRIDVKNINHLGEVQSNSHISTTWEYNVLNERIRRTSEADEERNIVTEWEYDNNLNQTLVRSGEATNGNQPTNVIRKLYDERNMLFRSIQAEGDTQQVTNQYDYDANGNQIRTLYGIEGTPHEHSRVYDGYNRLIESTDPMGNIQIWHYDEVGNVVSQRLEGELYDVPGNVDNVRLFEQMQFFDSMNRLIRTEIEHFDPVTQDPINQGKSVNRFEYSDNSKLTKVTDDNGNETFMTYDCAHRKVMVTDAKGNTVSSEYDLNGNMFKITKVDRFDTSGSNDQIFESERIYNNFNQLIQTIDNMGNTTTRSYDSLGNMRETVDQLGNVVRYEYDGLNRLLRTTRIMTDTGTGGGNPTGEIVTTLEWDDNWRRIVETDPIGNTTRYSYDALNRLISTTFADGNGQSFEYDVYGNEFMRKDPNGSVVISIYDPNNRVKERQIIPGEGVSADTTFERYRYDGQSRIVFAEDSDSQIVRNYDSMSNIIEEIQNGNSVSYHYDGVGNRMRTSYPRGRIIMRTYDGLNRQKTILDSSTNLATFDYIGQGRLEGRGYPTGMSSTTYTYDVLGRLVRNMSVKIPSQEVIDDQTYAWDAMYNRVNHTQQFSTGNQLSKTYSYDSNYRMRRAVVEVPYSQIRDTNYDLDEAGNRIQVTGGNCSGTYFMDDTLPEPADRQLNQYTSIPCDSSSRSYDANGNMVMASPQPEPPTAYTYDYKNRLVEIAYDENTSEHYRYDPFGRRIARELINGGTKTVEYFYDGWQVIEEVEESEKIVTTYVYGNHLDDVLNMQRNQNNYFYHKDSLGSVMAVTDSTGNVVEWYDYHDYGEPSFYGASGFPISSSAIGNPYLFAGARYDDTPYSDFDLYHLRTRYLDPLAGRFISRDTIGIWEDMANVGNGNTYAANNPQTLTDPTGRITCFTGSVSEVDVPAVFEDCSGDERNTVRSAICPAFRAVQQALWDAWQGYTLNPNPGMQLAVGGPGNFQVYRPPAVNSWMMATRSFRIMNRWFGGDDGVTSWDTRDTITANLYYMSNEWRSGGGDFECETGGARHSMGYKLVTFHWPSYAYCRGNNAYVPCTPWPDIHLCRGFFATGRPAPFDRVFQSGILNHEMSHYAADTVDGTGNICNGEAFNQSYYVSGPLNFADWNWNTAGTSGNTEDQLRRHADTYEGFLLQYDLNLTFGGMTYGRAADWVDTTPTGSGGGGGGNYSPNDAMGAW